MSKLSFVSFKVPTYNEHYEGAYDERGLEWRRLGARDKTRNILSLLGNVNVDSVLEFGCGTGAVLAEIARSGLGTTHIGVDLADPSAHRDPSAATLDLRRFDGRTIPLEDESVDLVYASHVVEHLPDPRGMLAEMARVARRWLYIEVPCELHLRTNQRDLQRTLDIGHINAFTPESFQLLLESCQLPLSAMALYDHSLPVHRFTSGRLGGLAKYAVRRSLLAASPRLASRVFTYHCGALISW